MRKVHSRNSIVHFTPYYKKYYSLIKLATKENQRIGGVRSVHYRFPKNEN